MRLSSLLLVFLMFGSAYAQEADPNDQQKKIPTTLAEAHVELERMLPAETLAKIDAMESEDGMIMYHHGLGTGLRNSWGLWGRSALAEHMRELGFTHADDMSGVILSTFWCKRHGKDFRIEERAAKYRAYWKATKEREHLRKTREEAMQEKMVSLKYEIQEVPSVQIQMRQRGLNTRLACPFRGGVFLAAYMQKRVTAFRYQLCAEGISHVDPNTHEACMKPEYDAPVRRGTYYIPGDKKRYKVKPGDDFYTHPYFFDSVDRQLHRINVPEVNDVYASMVAGGRAWLAGMTNDQAVIVGIGSKDRVTVPMPLTDEIPDLGLDGDFLLAVYCKTIYRLDGRQWTLIHSGDILLPRSGLPPLRHGNTVYFRDEGVDESRKMLWWLTMGDMLHLSALKRDVERAGFDGSSLYDMYSYCVTDNGDLWACACGNTLLHRSKDGAYSFPILKSSIELAQGTAEKEAKVSGLSITGVTALPDGALLLVGEKGLYRLKDNELVLELGFAPEDALRSWQPRSVLTLDDRSYFINSGSWNGLYLIEKGDDDQWSCLSPEIGDPVVW